MCKHHGLIFVDNRNIRDNDLCHDTLHLASSGTAKLANNFLQLTDVVNSFSSGSNLF